jgi:hypothetical protein
MLKIQYQEFVTKLHRLVDDEFELSTKQGDEVFRRLSLALFDIWLENKLRRQKRSVNYNHEMAGPSYCSPGLRYK